MPSCPLIGIHANSSERPKKMDLPDTIAHVRPAVVQIVVMPAQPAVGTQQVIGTGFWADNKGLALTAKHVTEEARKAIAQSAGSHLMLGIAVPSVTSPGLIIRSSFELIDADIVEEDQRHDLALFKAKPNPFETARRPFVRTAAPETDVYAALGVATLSVAEVRDGERIAVSGYPLQEPTLVTTSGGIASAFGTNIQPVQLPGAPPGFTMPRIADSYLADVAVNPGNSGGPVYRVADAEIIGVCVAFRVAQASTGQNIFFYNSGLSVVIPIKYGHDLIARHATD